MNCRNGHVYDVPKSCSDGYARCPVCYREGQARRDARRTDKPARWARDRERKRMQKIGW